MATTHNRAGTAVLETLAFVSELAMLVVLVIAGIGLGRTTVLRVVLAIMLPLLAILLWGRWLAPKAKARLADPVRLIAQYLLFVVTGGLAVIAGRASLGIAFAIVALVVFGLSRLGNGVSGRSVD